MRYPCFPERDEPAQSRLNAGSIFPTRKDQGVFNRRRHLLEAVSTGHLLSAVGGVVGEATAAESGIEVSTDPEAYSCPRASPMYGVASGNQEAPGFFTGHVGPVGFEPTPIAL